MSVSKLTESKVKILVRVFDRIIKKSLKDSICAIRSSEKAPSNMKREINSNNVT